MKSQPAELLRIKKLFNDHFNGDPWIDVNITGALKKISASKASKKSGELNSIWQIINHIIAWRETLLKRLKEEKISVPDDNFMEEITDTSNEAWKKTLKRFETSQKKLNAFLDSSNEEILFKISPSSGYSYYELLMSILIHDTYHLGQIVMLMKLNS